ncbi:MAG: efflux RND transporter periplasmic adaptor subunit [Rickettsiales bacterium]|jgi:HlyD family secretion protein|nr:efflux RND transporter periplasmic adaptor subunit [Rickettsiales bacterium]
MKNNKMFDKLSAFKGIWNWIKRQKWQIILMLAVGAAALYAFSSNTSNTVSQFASTAITRGDLHQVVTATGEIRPINTINVGSQVSGIIEKIYVDYNSKVKKGDVLLTIDPSVLQASVDEAKASLVSEESQRNYRKSEYARNKTLYKDGFISRAEMEQSQTNYEQAEQSVKRAKSQYERAVTNLGYATIISPVDGTVISRKVDKGQTVAASFQTPNLFEIAEDLSQMQIETSVSEADIGMIKENLTVTFSVDAYPTQIFEGVVRQIRLSPTTTSNVVVYTVVINVDNSDLRLMPGMTAFVTIMIAEKRDVWKVSNSALLLRSFAGIVENPGDATPKTHLAVERNGKVVLVPYEKGLVTATETEIISDDIQEKDRVVTGKLGMSATASASVKMGGGGGRGMMDGRR